MYAYNIGKGYNATVIGQFIINFNIVTRFWPIFLGYDESVL